MSKITETQVETVLESFVGNNKSITNKQVKPLITETSYELYDIAGNYNLNEDAYKEFLINFKK